MTSREPVGEQLVGPEQMRQVGARERRGRARQRQPSWTGRGSSRKRALRRFSRPSGTHSVPLRATRAGSTESNMSTPRIDRVEQVHRRAEAHQVARPRIVGEQRHDDVERRATLGRRLVAGQPADAEPVEWQRRRWRASSRARRSGSRPPWMMPNSAWSGRVCAARQRSAQRMGPRGGLGDLRRASTSAAAPAGRGRPRCRSRAPPGRRSSAPGVKRWGEPSRWRAERHAVVVDDRAGRRG